MKYSVVIPTYNHCEDLLKPCLEAIKKNTDLNDCEIIVVSNGSTDNTDDYVKSLGAPFKLSSYNEALGYARATNKGINVAKGDFIILLNNDAFLLSQPKNKWLDMLEEPFKEDPLVGITGPIKQYSYPAGREFIIFFCAMIRRKLFDHLTLNEEYGVGAGEDTEFCIEAEKLGYKFVQVPKGATTTSDNLVIGGFPIFHKGEATVSEIPNWQEIFEENSLKLAKKYNPEWYKSKLHNNFERAVIGKDDNFAHLQREKARYEFAAKNLVGKKILEIGCSSGYGLKLLPEDIEYTGIDYDPTIIEYAKENFGGPNRTFICVDANKFDYQEYDTIIAFEFIEHIDNGKEFAQKLKKHCKNLLITTPYKEPVGFWGIHHKLHGLSQKDFPGFDYKFIHEDGTFSDKPANVSLMVMRWEDGKIYERKPTILCSVVTKDRYDILSNCLQSVALQSRVPDKLIIYDDGEQKDLRELPIYKHLFRLFDNRGMAWEVKFTPRKGQHYGHHEANHSGYDYVWRIDDDEIAEPDVLEKLLGHMKEGVGAVAGAVFEPGSPQPNGSSALKDIFHMNNLQWAPGNEVKEVEHLYSSFLYRTGIAEYNLNLSPVAHREESLFSHEIFEKGYKLIVDTSIKTYHFRHDTGGIRSHDSKFFYEHDNKVFIKKMEEWGYKLFNLDVGLGDHFVFLNILPALLKKHKHLIIGCCYTEVFKNYPVTLIPVSITQNLVGEEQLYKWCIDNNWNKSILEAYKLMYGV